MLTVVMVCSKESVTYVVLLQLLISYVTLVTDWLCYYSY